MSKLSSERLLIETHMEFTFVHPESEFHIYVNIDIKVKTCSVVFDLLQPHGL